jgi:methylated-DNA-[protein]-cysteine S-methyltransferase
MVRRVRYGVVPSPLGDLIVFGDADGIAALAFADSRKAANADHPIERDDAAFGEARKQLEAYFAGELTRFELNLQPHGTPFQKRMWTALQHIPYGQTTTYGKLAINLGHPRAVRAVGLANARNPIPIVIPCHRVIGADGGLTGYGGGLQRKQWLLAHERGGI